MEDIEIYENPSTEIYQTSDESAGWAAASAGEEVPFHIPRD
ncbi:MAG TPA: hypothetical protein VHL58_01660 [Thermoanaerobaculia bacterium]|nr:hypothetical protein [Thermoanaerobaculia bacterium]